MITKNIYWVALFIALIVGMMAGFRAEAGESGRSGDAISLAGEWKFQLDPDNKGIEGQWYQKSLENKFKLPGTTDENRYGRSSLEKKSKPTGTTDENRYGTPSWVTPELAQDVMLHLTRKHSYIGAAWYQKEINIPEGWKDKHIEILLERVLWETRIWLDGQYIGMADSLIAPHRYVLPAETKPGKHKLTIRVDNSYKYDVGKWAHAYTEETQTIWNGIIGEISLKAVEAVRIEDIQVYPNVQDKKVKVILTIVNDEVPVEAKLVCQAVSVNGPRAHKTQEQSKTVALAKGTAKVEMEQPMGPEVRLWDEFEPALYKLTVGLEAETGGKLLTDEQTVRFGMRDIKAKEGKLWINNRRLFLRGTLECCIFPLTGHPPMDKTSWKKQISTAKKYGLNHLRFHSWCPPEAAFAAADEMGFYLQAENPLWNFNMGKEPKRDKFIEEEALRILKNYGNHPSFCLMSMGNELNGDYNYLRRLVKLLKDSDERHLYATSSNPYHKGSGIWPEMGDDFFISAATKKGPIRGQTLFNAHEPATNIDFRESIKDMPVPVISHEIGQHAVYPNMREIEKYTGVLDPVNLKAIRNDLKKKNMLQWADDFVKASGALSVLLYKESIEMIMRTEGMSGYQLLDLHDFPGQGTSLVGTLDAFWDSKGLITPEKYRRFCGPTVPLARMAKRIYENNERLEAEVEIFHYGQGEMKNAVVGWNIRDEGGGMVAKGTFKPMTIPTGELTAVGKLSTELKGVKEAKKLVLSVFIKDTSIINDWNVWVYPADQKEEEQGEIIIAELFDETVEKALKEGRKVLLVPEPSTVKDKITGCFTPVFWSPVLFRNQPGTMGLRCNTEHPALAEFPTDYHSNWQWWDLTRRSVAMAMDDLPRDFVTIVRTTDNFTRNHNLVNILEARVEKGKLLLCSFFIRGDLSKRPAARQLRHSLLNYMRSDKFEPEQELSLAYVKGLFKEPKNLARLGAKLIGVDSFQRGYEGYKAIDDDPKTMWHTSWSPEKKKYPHAIIIDLGKEVEVRGFSYLPRQDGNPNGLIAKYEFYVSSDRKKWGSAAAKGEFEPDASLKKVFFRDTKNTGSQKSYKGQFIRFVAREGFNNDPFTAIAELDIITD